MNKGLFIGLMLLAISAVSASAQSASPPVLISPSADLVMDNGCGDRSDSIDWDFEWAPVEGAKKYQIFVKTSRAPVAAIDKTTKKTKYEHRARASYTGPLGYTGWAWKVRAMVGKEWTAWSEERPFTMEPVNTDCKK